MFFGIQPPTSRGSERALELLVELLDAERYSEAAPLFDRLMQEEIDHFDGADRSVRRAATQAVADRPDAIEAMRVVLDGEYQRALGSATTAASLRSVIARYPPEVFGAASMAMLARAEADAGNYRTAAQVAATALETFPAANAALRGEMRQIEAANGFRTLGSQSEQGVLAGADLEEVARGTASAFKRSVALRAPDAWLSPMQSAAPPPLPDSWLAWRARLARSASNSEPITVGKAERLPATRAIAVDGVVVAPRADGLVAFDAASGKRQWRVDFSGPGKAGGRGDLIDRRASFGSRVTGALTSDGESVFVVSPAARPPVGTRRRMERSLFAFGRAAGSERPAPVNRLASYDIAAAGKLRWRIDGSDAAGPLPGVSFLGPPTVDESRLYALAEIEQSIVLLQLEAETGRITWRQPLLRCDREPSARVVALGARPTVGERLVYCPTGRGAVVAIDPIRQTLAWVHDIEVDPERAQRLRRQGWGAFGEQANDRERDGGDWAHCRLLAVDDVLLVVTPSTPELTALAPATGEALWRQEASGARLLSATCDGLAIVVGDDAVTAWRVSEGELAWSTSLPAGAAPRGDGLLIGNDYALPLSTGELFVVDAATGEARGDLLSMGANPLEDPPSLGNLLYHEGAIFAVSPEAIEAYRQRPAKSSGVATNSTDPAELRRRLAANPDDRELAERLAARLARLDTDSEQAGRDLPTLVSGARAEAIAALLRLRASGEAEGLDRRLVEAERLVRSPSGEVVLQPSEGLSARASRLAIASLAEGLKRDVEDDSLETIISRVAGVPAATAGPDDDRQVSTPPTWSTWQVSHQRSVDESAPDAGSNSSRRRRARQGVSPIRIPVASTGPRGVAFWAIESGESSDAVLLGVSRDGERLFAEKASDAVTRPSRASHRVGSPGTRVWRDWMVTPVDGGYRVVRFGHRVDNTGSIGAPRPISWSSVQASQSDWDASANDARELPVGVGPWGVLAWQGEAMTCRDLRTGRLQWRRRFRSEPQRALLYDDVVYAVLRDRTALRLTAWSGELEGADTWQAPPTKTWRGFADGRLLSEERVGGDRTYRIAPIDPHEGATERTFDAPATTLATVVDDRQLALLDESNLLTLVDIGAASEVFSAPLPVRDELPVRAMRAHRHAGRLLVEVDRANPLIDRTAKLAPLGSEPLLSGELHCLDPETGASLWRGPAEVSSLALIEPTITDSPLLFLARRRVAEPDAGGERPGSVDLVTLDLLSGATVSRDVGLPVAPADQPAWPVWVQRERLGESDRLLARVGGAWLTFKPTREARPPRPPLTARVEDPDARRPPNFSDLLEGLFGS